MKKKGADKKLFRQIEQLKNNGVTDFFIISHSINPKDKKICINAEAVEFIEDKCFIDSLAQNGSLEEIIESKLTLNTLYNLSKEKMVQINIFTKNLFAKILHEYQEM